MRPRRSVVVATGRTATDRPRLPLVLLLAGPLVLAGCTGGAPAAPEPSPVPAVSASPAPSPLALPVIAAGATEVAVDPGFLGRLEALGLVPGASGPAAYTPASAVWSFPVTGGDLTLGQDGGASGLVRHGGALTLASGTATVALTDLVLDAGRSVLTGTLALNGSAQPPPVPVLAADLAAAAVEQGPGTAVLRGVALRLTAEGAELLNQAPPGDGFTPGETVGVATITLSQT